MCCRWTRDGPWAAPHPSPWQRCGFPNGTGGWAEWTCEGRPAPAPSACDGFAASARGVQARRVGYGSGDQHEDQHPSGDHRSQAGNRRAAWLSASTGLTTASYSVFVCWAPHAQTSQPMLNLRQASIQGAPVYLSCRGPLRSELTAGLANSVFHKNHSL